MVLVAIGKMFSSCLKSSLSPGFYIWLDAIKIRIGGSLPEESYPGTHSPIGIALVLPGYRIYSSYQGSYNT